MNKKQSTKPTPPDADQVVQDFIDALAALIEHPETPAAVYNAFGDAYTDLQNQFSLSIKPEEEAAEIRAKLPEYIRRARQQSLVRHWEGGGQS